MIGDGQHTVADLIERQSRRRAAATGGESRIPLDDMTGDGGRRSRLDLDDVLPEGTRLRVRRTANLHTGGTIHDVTARAAYGAGRVARHRQPGDGIPVTGIDLLVPDAAGARIRVHRGQRAAGAGQPRAAAHRRRFIDFLFPGTSAPRPRWQPAGVRGASVSRS